MTFGEKVRAAREARNMTQEQLKNVKKIPKHSKPGIIIFAKLARNAFVVPVKKSKPNIRTRI